MRLYIFLLSRSKKENNPLGRRDLFKRERDSGMKGTLRTTPLQEKKKGSFHNDKDGNAKIYCRPVVVGRPQSSLGPVFRDDLEEERGKLFTQPDKLDGVLQSLRTLP